MMKESNFICYLSILLIVVSVFAWPAEGAADGGGSPPVSKCGDAFQKLMTCLDFVQGKVTDPTKQCCTAVEGMKESDPKCLCYIIQQTHGGVESLKSLGIQEPKLLQLPSSCQLKNASITNCPKLLGLSPSSPDAAIFSENTRSATPTPAGKGSPATSSDQKGGSARAMEGHLLFCAAAFLVISIFSAAFPMIGSAY